MMEIAIGVFAICVALYLPGYPFFRALRFSGIASAVAAPLFSCAVYGIFPIAYYEVGIPCNALTTFGVALVIGWGAFGIVRLRARGASPLVRLPQPAGTFLDLRSPREPAADWGLLLLYLFCGLAVCTLVFGMNMSSADVPYIRYDNQTHLTISKSFLESGMWSSLHPSRYLELPLDSRPIATGAVSFYPALLYGITALGSVLTGLKVTASFNAALFALCAVVFPTGMYAVMRVLFCGNRQAVALGALATMCFAGFPWGVFVRALFPNVAGLCLMMPAIGATMLAFASLPLKRAIPACVAIWVMGIPVLGLAQPNAVFAAYLFLVGYLAHVMGDFAASHAPRDGRTPLKRRIAAIAIVAIAGLVIWAICLNLPFLHSVVKYFGNSIIAPDRILRKLIALRFEPFEGQHLLAFVCLAGIVDCIRTRRLWLLFPVALFALAYFVVRTHNTPLTHILAGFWYTDHGRIAGVLCIFLAPVAAAGLQLVGRVVLWGISKIAHRASTLRNLIVWCVLVFAFAFVNFLPNYSVPIPGHDGERVTGFGTVHTYLQDMYSWSDKHVYGGDEHAFVQKAREIVGDDLVVNFPADGSTFAYSADNLNIFYRNTKIGKQTDAAKVIRKRLADYTTDAKVRKSVESTGVKYVLKLDHDVPFEEGRWFRQFKSPEKWQGILDVGDNTPGFTTVLAEGDMRLYRIGG
ncbi:MAG: hypothetical protein Q3963_03920 [Coriobacteriaceae bacterium]|nr:hypothetical protein [Coriobacteriaceae bacterium]